MIEKLSEGRAEVNQPVANADVSAVVVGWEEFFGGADSPFPETGSKALLQIGIRPKVDHQIKKNQKWIIINRVFFQHREQVCSGTIYDVYVLCEVRIRHENTT